MAVPVIATSPLSEINVLSPSWERALRAQNKSPRTIVGYLEGVSLLETYLRARGMPTNVTHLHREHVEAFVVDQVERWRPSTARTRFRSIQQFFRWCIGEGELRASPTANMTPPAIPDEPPAVLTDDQLRRLLKVIGEKAGIEYGAKVHGCPSVYRSDVSQANIAASDSRGSSSGRSPSLMEAPCVGSSR